MANYFQNHRLGDAVIYTDESMFTRCFLRLTHLDTDLYNLATLTTVMYVHIAVVSHDREYINSSAWVTLTLGNANIKS